MIQCRFVSMICHSLWHVFNCFSLIINKNRHHFQIGEIFFHIYIIHMHKIPLQWSSHATGWWNSITYSFQQIYFNNEITWSSRKPSLKSQHTKEKYILIQCVYLICHYLCFLVCWISNFLFDLSYLLLSYPLHFLTWHAPKQQVCTSGWLTFSTVLRFKC